MARVYAHEWRNANNKSPYEDVASLVVDFNAAAHQTTAILTFASASSTNKPTGFSCPAIMWTFEKTGSNAGWWQFIAEDNRVQGRKRAGSAGSYTWGNWGPQTWIEESTPHDVGAYPSVVEYQNIADETNGIPAIVLPDVGDDYNCVVQKTGTSSGTLELYALNDGTGGGKEYRTTMFYDTVKDADSELEGFGFVDIVAVGFADASEDYDWISADTNKVARVHYVSNGISVNNQASVVDGYSYGKPIESRVLEDPSSQFDLSVYLTDATAQPPDNRLEGKEKMVEIGFKNPSGDRMLLQLWEARCVSIDRQFPEGQFAFCNYSYRCVDFRWEIAPAAQILAAF